MANTNYKNLDNDLEVRPVLLQELTRNDPIYYPEHQYYAGNNLFDTQNDKEYGIDDRSISIFKNVEDIDLFCMFSNNIPMGIRHKRNINHEAVISGRSDEARGYTGGNGVYIVEKYCLSNTRELLTTSNLAKFYQASQDIYPVSPEVKDFIVANTSLQVKDFGNRLMHTYFRIVTFIPSSVFLQNSAVYIRSAGVVIGVSSEVEYIRHPESLVYKKYAQKLSSDCKNFIEVEINDPYRAEDYYIKVGNNVVALTPSRVPSNPTGGYLKYYRNQKCYDTKDLTLDNLKDHGIFNTAMDAEINANNEIKVKLMEAENIEAKLRNEKTKLENEAKQMINTQELKQKELDNENKRLDNENKKLDNDVKRLDNDNKKLDLDNKRLDQDNKKLELDNKKLELDNQKLEMDIKRIEMDKQKLEVDKQKIEYEYKKLTHDYEKMEFEKKKLELEYSIATAKHKILTEEAKINLINKYIDVLVTATKRSLDLEHLKNKVEYDKNKADLEIKVAIDKHNLDLQHAINKHNIDTIAAREKAAGDIMNKTMTTVGNLAINAALSKII